MEDINKSVDIGVNEYVSKYQVNRNIQKLLENDQYIYKLYNKYMKSGPGVFIKGLKYPIGYKVWYRDGNGNLGIYTNLLENNMKEPTAEDSRWINTSVSPLPDGILTFEEYYRKLTDDYVDGHISEYHENNPELVRSDLQNLGNFSTYPYETKRFRSANCNGYLRKWRNSVLEYFIQYRFSEKTVSNMQSQDIRKFFGGMLNSYGKDLRVFSNPTIPEDVNEYFETDTVRSVQIQFVDKYQFKGDDYCIFTSNALDSNGFESQDGIGADNNNYSPIDTVQIYNKTRSGFSVMRRFNGGSYVGSVVNNDTAEDYLRNVYRRIRPADKYYTVYIVGTWE